MMVHCQHTGSTARHIGTVLSHDGYLTLPWRVEYIAPNGDKRIERFAEGEVQQVEHKEIQ